MHDDVHAAVVLQHTEVELLASIVQAVFFLDLLSRCFPEKISIGPEAGGIVRPHWL